MTFGLKYIPMSKCFTGSMMICKGIPSPTAKNKKFKNFILINQNRFQNKMKYKMLHGCLEFNNFFSVDKNVKNKQQVRNNIQGENE